MPLAVVDHEREESIAVWATTGTAVLSASVLGLASARPHAEVASAASVSAEMRRQ
jgi:hypothetical protein